MARAGGAYLVSAAEADVLARLAPVFRIGGVLVGSHAFAVLGNMLTIAWKELASRGKAWVTAATSSLARLDEDLVAQLRNLGVKA